MRRGIAVAALACLASCGAFESVPSGAVTKCQATTVLPAKTDILFVVDDSGSMSEEQSNLATNFEAFITRLSQSPVKGDTRIGITTTSVIGFDGSTSYATGTLNAGTPYPAGALVSVDPATGLVRYDATAHAFTGTRILEGSSPTLVQDFEANVKVGTGGSSKEEGLEAMRLALRERVADGANAGFLRSGARLAVVIVSDEDDCTEPAGQLEGTTNDICHDPTFKATKLEPVDDFVSFLSGAIAGEHREVVVAGIIGIDQTTKSRGSTCSTAFDTGVRYFDLAAAFKESGLVDSICNSSFRSTLEDIASLISQSVDLDQAPSDAQLLAVSVKHASGTTSVCKVVDVAADHTGADAIFTAAQATRPASLTFQGACTLAPGDQVDVKVLCAG